MNRRYVLDACALIACLTGESGGETVKAILNQAANYESTVRMSKLNLLEVYYHTLRAHGKEAADTMLGLVKKTPIEIIAEISDEVLVEAGRLKAIYKLSLADTIAAAEASISRSSVVTADHHEFDALEGKEPVTFFWIR